MSWERFTCYACAVVLWVAGLTATGLAISKYHAQKKKIALLTWEVEQQRQIVKTGDVGLCFRVLDQVDGITPDAAMPWVKRPHHEE